MLDFENADQVANVVEGLICMNTLEPSLEHH